MKTYVLKFREYGVMTICPPCSARDVEGTSIIVNDAIIIIFRPPFKDIFIDTALLYIHMMKMYIFQRRTTSKRTALYGSNTIGDIDIFQRGTIPKSTGTNKANTIGYINMFQST